MTEASMWARPSADDHGLVLAAVFDSDTCSRTRRQVSRAAGRCGLPQVCVDDFTVAVNEIMANAVRHGGGSGRLRLWYDGQLLCEIADDGDGFLAAAYLERTQIPDRSPTGGMGLWLAQQMTAEIAIRSGTAGSTVRLRASADGPSGNK